MTNKKIWYSIADEYLSYLNETSEFLQGEFCSIGSDPIWSPQYLNWKIGSGNPVGKGYLNIAISNNKVVGSVSLSKKRLLINGIECIGGEVGDSYTSKSMLRGIEPQYLYANDDNPESYVNKSIFGRLATEIRQRAEEDGVNLIYGVPNKNAYPSWVNRLNYSELSKCKMISLARPTSRWIARNYPILRGFMNALGILDCALIKLKYLLSSKWYRIKSIDEIPSDNQIDSLWNRVKPIHGISQVRDSEFYRYRFKEHPLAKYNFHAIYLQDRLLGFCVSRYLTADQNKKIVCIVDVMVENEKNYLNLLILLTMKYYENYQVDFYNTWVKDGSDTKKIFRRNIFLKAGYVPIIIANSVLMPEILSNNFDFNIGSTDAY